MSELSDIFERDPLSLTKDDPLIELGIKAYRDMRFKFNLGDLKAGSMKPKAAKANPTVAALLADDEGMELKI